MLKLSPNRVLHVVYAMNTGGIETWLMSIYRKLDREKIQFDFVVNTIQEAYFDSEIKQLGGNVIFSGPLKNPISIFRAVNTVLKSDNYTAVHCHNVENAVPVLAAAVTNKIKIRIFHSHNDFNKTLINITFLKKMYLKFSRRLSIQLSNRFLAVSKVAGDSLFAGISYQLISLGIDLEKFKLTEEKQITKSDFALSVDDLVIGHVGRFNYQKNHVFLVEVAKELIKLNPHSKFLLIGNGTLEEEVKRKISDNGYNNYFVFAGVRSDVPKVMIHVMDAFLFPSLFEGLGLVLVEAQAAGLPIVCSKVIPDEAIVNKDLIQKIDLSKSAKEWAELILENYRRTKVYDKNKAYQKVFMSSFNLNRSIKALEDIWQGKI